MPIPRTAFALTCALAAIAAPAAAQPIPPASIAGPDGGWDYARVDAASRTLYVARSASVTAIDLTGRAPVRSIGSIAHGHAVLPVPGGSELLVTSGGDDSVRFLDAHDGRETARIAVGSDPDGAAIDAQGRTAYVMNAKAGTIAVIDVGADRVRATIALVPGLEYPALAKDGTLFVNNEDANTMTAIDTRTDTVSATIALTGCEGPSGLGYDARTDTLIAACANGKAAIVAAGARRLTGLVDIGQGPDAVIVDAARRHAYIPCGRSGELDMLSLDGPQGPSLLRRIATEPGARTGALDPADGAVYLPTARFGAPPAAGTRPAPLPGSFHLLIVRP